MATSGSIYTGRRNYTRFYLDWSLADQDITNNRSLIKWEIGVQGQDGYTAYWYSNAVTINSGYINGSRVSGSSTYSNITLSGASKHKLRSGSTWVGHSSNGSKSVGFSVSGALFGNGTISASDTFALPTIPRNSQVSTNASSYTLGDPITIYTNRKSSSFTHTITIRQSNSSGTIIKSFNSIGSSVTWTPTETEINTMQAMIPNSNTLTIYIDQYNNQVKDDSHVTRALTIADANPVFEDFTYEDTDATTIAITGDDQVLVKGKSVLEVSVSSGNKMEAVKSATEDRYTFAYDGASEQEDYAPSSTVSATFSTIPTIGTRTIVVTAYDSRDNATKVSKNVTVYDYTEPTIVTTLERENNFGSDTTVHIEGTYTPLVIGGVNKNSLQTGTLEYRYKEDGGSFGSWTTKTFSANTTAGTFSVTDFVVALDNTKKYIFEFHIDDEFGTVTTTNSVDIGVPIMFVGQNSGSAAVGINKMPTQGALDVDGDIYMNGEKVATASTPVAFMAYKSSSMSVANSTFTKVVYNVEIFDVSNDYNTTTGVFTAPVEGIYSFSGGIDRASGYSNSYRHILAVFKNGTEIARLSDDAKMGGQGTFALYGSVDALYLNVGDTIDMRMWHAVGSTQSYGSGTQHAVYFSGVLKASV